MSDKIKYILEEEKIPKFWYNIEADLPKRTPAHLNSATNKPITTGELEIVFAKTLVEQELSSERYIEIPKPVRDIMRQWRP